MPVYHHLSPLYILCFSFLYFFASLLFTILLVVILSQPCIQKKHSENKRKLSSSQVPGLHRISDVQQRDAEAKVRVPHQQGTKPGISYVTAFSQSHSRMRFRKDCQYCALQKICKNTQSSLVLILGKI